MGSRVEKSSQIWVFGHAHYNYHIEVCLSVKCVMFEHTYQSFCFVKVSGKQACSNFLPTRELRIKKTKNVLSCSL